MADRLSEAKARQVYLVLRDRIVSGATGFGARLPNENELAQAHGVSRVTGRRALAELERERLIERRRSAGTRIIYRPAPAPITADISGVLANIAEMGRRTAVKLLSFDYVPGEGPAAEALGVKLPETLQRAVRIRAVDGEPFSYLTTHVPERIGVTYSKQELGAGPLLELLERSGHKVERATQRIGAGLATPAVAAALDVKIGSPLIELVRVTYDARGRGVEHLHALYRPDRYSFEIELLRSGPSRTRAWSPVTRAGHKKNGKKSSKKKSSHVISAI